MLGASTGSAAAPTSTVNALNRAVRANQTIVSLASGVVSMRSPRRTHVVVDEQAPGTDRQKLAVRITAQWKPAAARKPIAIDPDPAKTEKPKTGEKENKSNAPPATTAAPPANTVLPAMETKK